MPLSEADRQELQELRRLDELEAKFANHPQAQQAPTAPTPTQPGLLEKGIDMIPGMQQRREQIAQHRATPEYQQSHPQPNDGSDDPVYSAMGMASEAPFLGVGAGISKLKNFLKPAAQRSEVLSKVKNVKELEPYVQGKVNEAAEMFNKKQIGPRMLEQQSRMAEGTIKVDPKALQGLSPELDQIVQSMVPGSDGLAEIPASQGLEIRKHINSVSGWKAHPMDMNKARATDAQAAGIHQDLSQQFSSIDPAMEPLSKELQAAYTTQKQAIGSAGKNPINAVLPNENATGLAKRGRLANFDEQAGSDLTGLGRNIKTANDRLRPMSVGDVFSITGPKQVTTKLLSPGARTYDAAAEAVLPTLEEASSNPNTANLSELLRYIGRPKRDQ